MKKGVAGSKESNDCYITVEEANNTEIIIDSWLIIDDKKIVNNYIVQFDTENRYKFIVTNSKLGVQSGTFHVDRNVIYSKFQIDKTGLSGFEILVRNENKCQVYGCLYDGKNLINSWQAKLIKSK